jgi:hypothetical protein
MRGSLSQWVAADYQARNKISEKSLETYQRAAKNT